MSNQEIAALAAAVVVCLGVRHKHIAALALVAALTIAGLPARAWSAESCTDQWRRHGHTTQAAAKAFAISCLRQQGAVPQTLSPATLAAKLAAIVTTSHPLANLQPQDIATFCPRYPELDIAQRARVWQTMLGRIAKQESNLGTAVPYWEKSQGQYSLGLLQLSLSDEQRYHCGIASEVDLTDADRNLGCGAKIMATLINRAGRVGGDRDHFDRGAAAYWSTLRAIDPNSTPPDGAPPRDSRSKVIEAVMGLAFCRR